MLEKYHKQKKMSKAEFKARTEALTEQLEVLQRTIQKHDISVIILVGGWSASGKGTIIADMIEPLDPRNYSVFPAAEPSREEERYPFLKRFWSCLPPKGKILIIERGWYKALYDDKEEGLCRKKDYASRLDSIKRFERTLGDNGCVLFKFFLHIDEKTQMQRLDKLAENENGKWRVKSHDIRQNRKYDEYFSAFDRILEDTNSVNVPWHVIPSFDDKYAAWQIFQILTSGLQDAIAEKQKGANKASQIILPEKRLLKTMPIRQIPLNVSLSSEEYREELEDCQVRLKKLQNRIYRERIPFVIAYEGWDAAGKGGNIKRLCQSLDPRGYEVIPISAPSAEELAHHYLWRFWTRLPKSGHIAVFDRTWYGRVLVERIEGFCTEQEYKRAYDEINEFEYELDKNGFGIVKFWLQIDKDEQLRRFHERENTPSKRWKITEEDWRNRDRWDSYETAVDEMLAKTSTQTAPWHIIESNNKKYARIKALKTVIQAIEKKLEQ